MDVRRPVGELSLARRGTVTRSFTILTMAPNAEMSELHDRMPAPPGRVCFAVPREPRAGCRNPCSGTATAAAADSPTTRQACCGRGANAVPGRARPRSAARSGNVPWRTPTSPSGRGPWSGLSNGSSLSALPASAASEAGTGGSGAVITSMDLWLGSHRCARRYRGGRLRAAR